MVSPPPEVGSRWPDHPEAGVCVGHLPERCATPPSFIAYCEACFAYFEMCAAHAMTWSTDSEGRPCPCCDRGSLELHMIGDEATA